MLAFAAEGTVEQFAIVFFIFVSHNRTLLRSTTLPFFTRHFKRLASQQHRDAATITVAIRHTSRP